MTVFYIQSTVLETNQGSYPNMFEKLQPWYLCQSQATTQSTNFGQKYQSDHPVKHSLTHTKEHFRGKKERVEGINTDVFWQSKS